MRDRPEEVTTLSGSDPLPALPPPPGLTPPRGRSGVPAWVLPAALAVAVLVALATATLAFTQRQEVQRLRADLGAAEARIVDLEERLAEAEADGGDLDALLEDLLGGEGDLDGLLDGLLDGGLEGLFDGLGDVDDLFGGAGSLAMADCLGGSGLGGLLGGSDPITAADLPAQLDAIAERVASLRGLPFREPVEPELVASGEFEARITEIIRQEYTAEDADLDRRVLAGFGAVDQAVDLRGLTLDLVGEQAAGFYSTDTETLVVRADDPDALLGPAEQVILAHELEHALTDQNLGLPVDPDDRSDADEERASLALVEGGATLLMQRFAVDALDMGDQLAMATDPSVGASQRQIGEYPDFLQRELVFPYTEGLGFTCQVHADGGWDAVDAAYEAPPTTTAQVLWPERYAAGEDAVEVADLGAPRGSWSPQRATTLGAAELLWLYAAPGDDEGAALDDPRGRAAAWAGGEFAVWTDGDDSAVGVSLAQRSGEPSLCDSMTAWYGAAFPGSQTASPRGDEALAVTGSAQSAVVVCDGQDVLLGIAPDLSTARQVAG